MQTGQKLLDQGDRRYSQRAPFRAYSGRFPLTSPIALIRWAVDPGNHLGTVVNGILAAHFEQSDEVALRFGDNEVQLGGLESPDRFRTIIEREPSQGQAISPLLNCQFGYGAVDA